MKSMSFVLRILIGVLLLIGGLLGALPVLGFWMIPLGLLVLSIDFRWARKGYLSIIVWLRKIRHRRNNKNGSA
ncbi:MAG: PGPGW domain-containing protein [bacterium]